MRTPSMGWNLSLPMILLVLLPESLGGTASISDDVKAQLPGIKFVRLAGDDAMKTSAEIANFCVSEGMSPNEMAVASGSTYYDAVTGAAFCGSKNSVLLLVLDGDRTAITDFVAPRKSAIERGYIFGGTASVSENLQLALERATADR